MSEFSDNLPHRLEFPCIYVLHKRGLVKYFLQRYKFFSTSTRIPPFFYSF